MKERQKVWVETSLTAVQAKEGAAEPLGSPQDIKEP